MIKVSVKTDFKGLSRTLGKAAREQIPVAAAKALTRTAQSAERAVQGEIARVFDRPTPWIQRGTFVVPATDATLAAVVGIKDQGAGGRSQALYLREHVSGGPRGNKPYEGLLRGLGVLPDGWFAVPGAGMPRNRFGNPERRALAALLTQLRDTPLPGRRRHSQSSVPFFVVRPEVTNERVRHLAPGIYQRRVGGLSVVPMLLFVRHATYRRVFDVQSVVEDVVARRFGDFFRRALG